MSKHRCGWDGWMDKFVKYFLVLVRIWKLILKKVIWIRDKNKINFILCLIVSVIR